MILYHGSNIVVETPDIEHSRINVDFGKGFYTTPIYEQAQKWCKKFKRQGTIGVVSKYDCDESKFNQFKVLEFTAYTEDWLDYILNCRNSNDTTDYDIVIGGVANDKVFNTVELFFDGLIDKTEAIKRLKSEKPNLQIAFRTSQAICACLKFIGSETL